MICLFTNNPEFVIYPLELEIRETTNLLLLTLYHFCNIGLRDNGSNWVNQSECGVSKVNNTSCIRMG